MPAAMPHAVRHRVPAKPSQMLAKKNSRRLYPTDFLLAINGVPFTGESQLHDIRVHFKPGQTISVSVRTPAGQVQRGGGFVWPPARSPLVSGPRHYLSHPDFRSAPARAPYRILGSCCTPTRSECMARPYCCSHFPRRPTAIFDFSFWPEPWYALLDLWNVMVQVFVLPALLWFGFLFPERWRADLRLPWFKYAILAASSGAFVLELGFSAADHFYLQSHPLLFRACRSGPIMFSSSLTVTCVLLFLSGGFRQITLRIHGRCSTAIAGVAIGSACRSAR